MNNRLFAGLLLAGALTAGYAFPPLTALLEPYVLPSLFIMILCSLLPMARLNLDEVFSLDPAAWRIVLWQLFVLPTIILAAAYLAKFSASIIALMAVTACAGSLFASPALADLLGLNRGRALQCMILSTFIMPFSYFLFFDIVLHASIQLHFAEFIGRSGIFLLLPTGLFLLYSAFAPDFGEETIHKIETAARWVTIIALIIFGIGILGPASELLRTEPNRFLLYLFIVTGLGAGMAFLTAIVMYHQGITDAMTASIVSGFRNVGLGFVLIGASWEGETAAYVGISQIPIFFAPLVIHLLVQNRQNEKEDAGRPVPLPA
jgi:predicted Na+-dependent transporter